MIKFTEINWASRAMRGAKFGTRGNTFVNIKGRGPWVVHCKTGSKPEQRICLSANAHGSFGSQVVYPVFSTDPDGYGVESKDFSNLYMSDDGTDQWPATGFGPPVARDPGLCGLKPNTDYYFYIPEIVGGHPSLIPGIRIGYQSMSDDSLADFGLDEFIGVPMFNPFTGESGTWYPDET